MCLFWLPPTIISCYFRLGKESAEAYKECLVNHWSKKREKTVEEKSALAMEYSKKIKSGAMHFLVHIYSTSDIDMILEFLHALRFVNNMFKKFTLEYFPNIIYPTSIITKRQEYYPLLRDMYQHDMHALLSDIFGFTQRVELELPTCKTVVKLNKYIQMAHTVAFYFDEVKRNNPCFSKQSLL